jgi:hypothetical protein
MDSRSVNKERNSHFIDAELWEIAKNVPCHGELMRYTWWHNYANELTRRKRLPVHYLFYEEYAEDWENTVAQLFKFIEIVPAPGAEPMEFIVGKHYDGYFTRNDLEMARELVRTLASPETWDLVKRYFA